MNNQKLSFKHSQFLLISSVILLSLFAAIDVSATNRNPVGDYDGDGKSDIAVFRPSDTYWYIWKSSGGYSFIPWGRTDDTPIPGDYDGDGKTDLAVFRPGYHEFDSINNWYILRSSDFNLTKIALGLIENHNTSFLAAAADYDGDGKTDAATFTSPFELYPQYTITANYFDVLPSSTNSIVRRILPLISPPTVVSADYDGDGKADFTTYKDGLWTIGQSTNGKIKTVFFGLSTDKLVPADYDGDGKADIAVWRPSNGYWYWLSSRDSSFNSYQFGQSGDALAPSDYDGDGRTDFAVVRLESGYEVWYIQQSIKGFRAVQFGLSGDIPVTK